MIKKCIWCLGDKTLPNGYFGRDPNMPRMLDNESGTLCKISGNAGFLQHGFDDYFWRCKLDYKKKKPYYPLESEQAEVNRIVKLINKMKRL